MFSYYYSFCIMYTDDLIKNFKNSKIMINKFQGVYPCDKLPKNVEKPGIIVANTDPSYKSGEHWVAFYFPKNKKGEYFSSYGDYPKNKYFIKFLHNNSSSFITNTHRLQSDFSSCCGHYCCVYLYYRCKGVSLNQFLNLFSKSDYEFNDRKIMRLYKKHFGKQYGGRKILNQYNQTCCSKSYKRRHSYSKSLV